MVAAPDSENGVIQFENVGLRYGLGPEILRDLSFKITPHSFQFLSGPSGAGKTSLLRLLRLFIELNKSGTSVVIATHDIALMDQYDARRLVLHDGRIHVYD
jgi:cell division transport system ATP-binding protein